MANEDFRALLQKLGDAPVKKGNESDYLNRSLIPVVRQLTEAFQRFTERPQLPVRDTSGGAEDALLEPFEKRPVPDGAIMIGLDGSLHVRVSGVWQAV